VTYSPSGSILYSSLYIQLLWIVPLDHFSIG